jgi:ketosteroid isomerase-like protein
MSNLDVVQRAFGAALAQDWDTVRPLLHDDFTWTIPGRSRISGDAVGVDAFAARFGEILAGGLHVELLDTLAAGEHVVTVQRNSAPPGDGGPALDLTAVNLFTVRDGKLARMQSFVSDQYALDAYWGPAAVRTTPA